MAFSNGSPKQTETLGNLHCVFTYIHMLCGAVLFRAVFWSMSSVTSSVITQIGSSLRSGVICFVFSGSVRSFSLCCSSGIWLPSIKTSSKNWCSQALKCVATLKLSLRSLFWDGMILSSVTSIKTSLREDCRQISQFAWSCPWLMTHFTSEG